MYEETALGQRNKNQMWYSLHKRLHTSPDIYICFFPCLNLGDTHGKYVKPQVTKLTLCSFLCIYPYDTNPLRDISTYNQYNNNFFNFQVGVVELEEFNWKQSRSGKVILHLQTVACESVALTLPPGRSVFRIHVEAPGAFALSILAQNVGFYEIDI